MLKNILILLPFFGFTQTALINYKVNYKSDFNTNLDAEIKKFIKDDDNDLILSLIINKNQSILFYENIVRNKSLSYFKTVIDGIYYYDVDNKTYYQSTTAFNKRFVIRDTLNSKKWDLINETKLIGNYKCYKAIFYDTIKLRSFNNNGDKIEKKRLKKVEAWYNPEINYNIGLFNYFGLPGLIMELHDDIFVYTISSVDFKINEDNIEKISKPANGILLSKKDFDIEYERLFYENEERMKN